MAKTKTVKDPSWSEDDFAAVLWCLQGKRGELIAIYGDGIIKRLEADARRILREFGELKANACAAGEDLRKHKPRVQLEWTKRP